MLDIRYSLSLRNVEDLLHERGIDITHETVRFDAPPLSLSGVSSARPDGR